MPLKYYAPALRQKTEKARAFLSERTRLIVLGILLLILFMIVRKAALFLLFTALTAYIVYYSKLYHLPFDVSPLFFLEVVITRYYGIQYTLFFILFGYLIPKVVAGSAANWMSYAFVALSVVCNLLSLAMSDMSLQLVGYITSVIQYVGGIFITMTMKPFYFAALDGLANVTNNLLYFLIFSDLIVFIFRGM